MLLSLRFLAVILGMGAGALVNALVALTAGSVLTVLGVDDGMDIVLVPSLIVGLMAGGYLAGRMAFHSARLHGAVAGVGVALVTLVTAQPNGSQARLGEVLILALVSIVFGGIGGILSEWPEGRRRGRRR